jgi:hypothetical protein
VAWRSIRVVRFLRLSRILKLTRYSRAIQRFHRALLIARQELLVFGAAALVLLYVEMPHYPGDTLDDWRSVICRMRGDAADERLEHFIESLRMAGWR